MNRWVWVVRHKARWPRIGKVPAVGERLVRYWIPAFDTLAQANAHGYKRCELVKVDMIDWAAGGWGVGL